MARKRSSLALALLAAVPAAYHRLYNKTYGNRKSSDKIRSLPDVHVAGNDFYLREETFNQELVGTVLPYLKSREQKADFMTTHRIHYVHYKADEPTASLVICHGYGENIERYAEASYYFLKMGYDVFLPEHYGHGSSKAGVTDPSVVWVDDFDTYTFDYYRFINDIVKEKNKELPIVCFGHSMGGTILARALQLYPKLCGAAILTSPLLQLQLHHSESMIFPVTLSLAKTGLSKSKIPLDNRYTVSTIEKMKVEHGGTTSPVRGRFAHETRWNNEKPARWIPSWGWISEMLKATHEIVKKENVEKISASLLMFQAETDWFADPKGLFEFAAHARDIELYQVPGSLHELYSEADEILVPYFNKINQFITRFLQKKEEDLIEHALPEGF